MSSGRCGASFGSTERSAAGSLTSLRAAKVLPSVLTYEALGPSNWRSTSSSKSLPSSRSRRSTVRTKRESG
jgi:hypothetical protein